MPKSHRLLCGTNNCNIDVHPQFSPDNFLVLEGSWGQPQGGNFLSPWATMLALRRDCSTAALTAPQKVLPIWKLVELKMLDFSDCTRTCISILTSAADPHQKMIAVNTAGSFFSRFQKKQSKNSFRWVFFLCVILFLLFIVLFFKTSSQCTIDFVLLIWLQIRDLNFNSRNQSLLCQNVLSILSRI